jgi:uncharacterized protein DUF4465
MKLRITLSIILVSALATCVSAATADFESLPLSGPESFYNGDPGGLSPGMSNIGTFTHAGIAFPNKFTQEAGFSFWGGWSYSNIIQPVAGDFENQYMAWPAIGAGRSAKYGVAFVGSDPSPTLTLPAGFVPSSMQVTNTTYAGIAIQNGNAFSRKFGDNPATPGTVETNFPDYFKLTIAGRDAVDQPVGTPIEVYLADYRFANDAQDYVLREWLPVGLSSLSGAAKLTFDLETTDVGQFGPNTPLYFAMDNLVIEPIPEPESLALCVACVAGMVLLPRCKLNTRAVRQN